jgi:hypothetical protein
MVILFFHMRKVREITSNLSKITQIMNSNQTWEPQDGLPHSKVMYSSTRLPM